LHARLDHLGLDALRGDLEEEEGRHGVAQDHLLELRHLVGVSALEHVVEAHSPGVPVAGGGGVLAPEDLRGHEDEGPDRGVGPGEVGAVDGLHQPEVQQDRAPVEGPEHVVGLHVPVGEPVAVELRQPLADLEERLEHVEVMLLHQRCPLEALHHDVGPLVDHVVGEDLDDVGVGQGGEGPGLPAKARQRPLPVLEGDDLEGGDPVELPVPDLEDRPHGALSEDPHGLVALRQGAREAALQHRIQVT